MKSYDGGWTEEAVGSHSTALLPLLTPAADSAGSTVIRIYFRNVAKGFPPSCSVKNYELLTWWPIGHLLGALISCSDLVSLGLVRGELSTFTLPSLHCSFLSLYSRVTQDSCSLEDFFHITRSLQISSLRCQNATDISLFRVNSTMFYYSPLYSLKYPLDAPRPSSFPGRLL